MQLNAAKRGQTQAVAYNRVLLNKYRYGTELDSIAVFLFIYLPVFLLSGIF